MKHIKPYLSFEKVNESLVEGLLGGLSVVGLFTGYDVIKSFIPYSKFKLAERKVKNILKPYMNDPELDKLCNDYLQAIENKVDYIALKEVNRLFDERISDLLSYEDYLVYKKYIDTYDDRDLMDR